MQPQPGPAPQPELGAEEHREPEGHGEPGEGHHEAEVDGAAHGGGAPGGGEATPEVWHSGSAGAEALPEQVELPTWRSVTIGKDHAGRRVDVYMAARFEGWSRTEINRAIKEGLVESALGRRLKPSTRLREHEVLKVFIPGLAPEEPPPPLPPVLYEDARLMVFDKPAGMLVHPSGRTFVYALIGLARAARPGLRLDLVHRLDRDTSGAILMTKELEANRALKAALHDGYVKKQYLALVHGRPDWDTLDCQVPLGEHTSSEVRLRRGPNPEGQHAHTAFRVVQRMARHSLVACRLHTGRTHQIRAHLEHLGHPILGDKLYGQEDHVFLDWLDHGPTEAVRRAVGFPRHCLHAWRVAFPHPDGHRMGVEAPLPVDMQAVVDGEPPAWPA